MSEKTDRREFIGTAAKLAATAAALAAAGGLGPVRALAQGKEEPEEEARWVATLGKVQDLNEKEPQLVKAQYRDADGQLLKEEKVYVRWERLNSKTGRWIVLSAICTHLKCKVEYVAKDGLFRCPCHGSEFELDGEVAKKPAKQPLADLSERAYEEDGQLKLWREPD